MNFQENGPEVSQRVSPSELSYWQFTAAEIYR
jgi:hypothetical protein